jgi:acyl-CoA synthetase (AMP-forming)/AMP-acid ligase II
MKASAVRARWDFPLPGVSAKLVEGEIWLRGPEYFRGLLGPRRGHRAAFVGWLVSHRRYRDGFRRRILHAQRAQKRSDYFRRLQYLSARDRGVSAGASRDCRSGRGGSEDRVRGEVPVAYLVCTETIDPQGIEAHCRAKLASFKVPREFIVVEKLPRNAMGKIQKHLLANPGSHQ